LHPVAQLLNHESLEERLAYHFQRPELLAVALTHSSAAGELQPSGQPLGGGGAALGASNERLEFLGDAVLALAVSESLVSAFPGWSEGQLSKSRARLVNAGSLAEAARRLELGAHLRLGKGEENTGGREKSGLLADAFEAVVAAVYLDGGLDAAREFLRRTLMVPALVDTGMGLAESDRKSALQEFLQARGQAPAAYRVFAETGPEHRKQFEVEVWVEGKRLAAGSGSTKKEAEQRAAFAALLQLQPGKALGEQEE
jgi:ribonuclease-3